MPSHERVCEHWQKSNVVGTLCSSGCLRGNGISIWNVSHVCQTRNHIKEKISSHIFIVTSHLLFSMHSPKRFTAIYLVTCTPTPTHTHTNAQHFQKLDLFHFYSLVNAFKINFVDSSSLKHSIFTIDIYFGFFPGYEHEHNIVCERQPIYYTNG